MIQPVRLIRGFAGQIQAQLAEHALVRLGEDDGGVGLAARQLRQLFHRLFGVVVGDGADGQRDQDLVGVQPGVAVAHVGDLEVLYRLDDGGGDQLDLVGDAGQLLQGVQQRGGGSPQQVGGLAGDDAAVVELDGHRGLAGLFGQIKPLLDKYDPNGAIAGFIKELIDVDLHAWDDYAEGGKYEKGRDWGFDTGTTEAAIDANGEIFGQRLIELLTPAAPIFAWMLADKDFTLLAEGDGLGANTKPIQLTFPGAEGYKYALVPLFEALNIDGSPKNLVQNLRDGDICDPATYTANVKNDVSFAVKGVVDPLIAMLQKLMDSTASQLLELFPSITYFINSNGIDTVVKNLIHSLLIIANAAEPMQEQIKQLVYDEQGFDLYRTINLEKIIKEQFYTLIGVSEEDVKAIYIQSGGTWQAVDGLEDIDFRLLYSIGIAALNNLLAREGYPFKFTTIVGLAAEELTHGYVRSYQSLTDKTAYTMILDKEIDRYCYGDLLSILMRIALKFLSVDGNVDALMSVLRAKTNISDTCYQMTRAFLLLLASYMQTLGGFEVAMLTIYYTIYGDRKASDGGVYAYDRTNDRLAYVVEKLTNLDNDIARAVLQALLGEADEQMGDIIGTQGLAGNGLIRFFKQIWSWLQRIINFFKNLF